MTAKIDISVACNLPFFIFLPSVDWKAGCGRRTSVIRDPFCASASHALTN